MKKILYILRKMFILIAGALLLFSSCNEDEFLKETPLDFLAPENAYSSVEGITQGLVGIYDQFRSTWYYGGQGEGGFWRGMGSDIAYHGEDPNSNSFITNYATYMIPANGVFASYWEDCYSFIQQANVLIDRIENSNPAIWESEAQKNALLGEARFFRAYHYRFLVSNYGDVPLVTEVIQSAKTDFTRQPKAEVYAVIESDFVFAAANLPGRGETDPGRVTNAAAYHMLAEIYLEQDKFQQAVDAASTVIDDLGYELMTERFGSQIDVFPSGGDVYWDLFRYGAANDPANTENIWAIQFEPYTTGGGPMGWSGTTGWAGERYLGPAYFRWGNTPDGYPALLGDLLNGRYTGYSDSFGRPVAHIRPTNYASYLIWQSDWNNDIRNAPHNIKRVFYFDNPESAYDGQVISTDLYPPGTRDALRDTNQYIFPYFMKFADPLNHFTEANRAGGGYTYQDPYVLRVAETYLFRAEAYIGLNMLQEAADDINAVRERSNATPVLPGDVDIDYLLDERARELYGEEYRHITLRRVGKLIERVQLYCNNPGTGLGQNIQPHNVLFPIPLSEIDLNIDGDLQQNPGYE